MKMLQVLKNPIALAVGVSACLVIGNGDQIVFDVESLDIEDLKR